MVTYRAYRQREAHSVENSGGDGTGVERVHDAFIFTEKSPLIGLYFAQVKCCQGQTSCGWKEVTDINNSARLVAYKGRALWSSHPLMRTGTQKWPIRRPSLLVHYSVNRVNTVDYPFSTLKLLKKPKT